MIMKLGIVDYGVGNIFSLKKAFEHLGIDVAVTGNAGVLNNCSGIILPGVGAFCDAAANIFEGGLDQVIREQAAKGKTVLGICLGMQLLFDYSTEGGVTKGLGLFPGWVDRIPDSVKVPHMGWNSLENMEDSKLFEGIGKSAYVYFVHSYYAKVRDKANICAVSSYGTDIPAVVKRDNILGMQFHPEKSGRVGLNLLNNVKEMLI